MKNGIASGTEHVIETLKQENIPSLRQLLRYTANPYQHGKYQTYQK